MKQTLTTPLFVLITLWFLAAPTLRSDEVTQLVTFQSLQNGAEENWRYIDTRSPVEFRKLHRDHSLNMACFKIATAGQAWKRNPILIIGNGANDHAMCRRAAALEKQGFSQVRVLQGGIASIPRSQLRGEWIQANRLPVVTTERALLMTTKGLGVAAHYGDTDPSTQAVPASSAPIQLKQFASLIEVLEFARASEGPEDSSPLLLLLANAEDEQTLCRALLRETEPVRPIYRVEASLPAFLAAAQQSTTSNRRQVTEVHGGSVRSFYSGTPTAPRASCCD